MTLRSSFVGFLVKYEQHIQHMSYIPTMLELFCIVGLLLWSCEEVLNVEVLIIVLCLSSLSNWLVGFWSGDSHCFMFVFFCFWFCNLYFVFFFFCFFFVSGFLGCFFCLFLFCFFLFFYLFGDFQSLLRSACHNNRVSIQPIPNICWRSNPAKAHTNTP